MKELWGETGQEKNTDVAEAETHNEDALMLQLTDFFMDLVHNIQSRSGYDKKESPGDLVHEVRLHRPVSGKFVVWCKSTAKFQKMGCKKDIYVFKSLFQKHGTLRSKIPPYGPFSKTRHGWHFPMNALPLNLQQKLGVTLWRSSIHDSLPEFINGQLDSFAGASDSFSLILSETDAEASNTTLRDEFEIEEDFIGSSQSQSEAREQKSSPARITRSNSTHQGAALIQRLASEQNAEAEQRPGQEPRQSAGLEQRQTDGQEKIRKAGQEQRQSAELESKNDSQWKSPESSFSVSATESPPSKSRKTSGGKRGGRRWRRK